MAAFDPRFVDKLREQLRFIERSCAAFDGGNEEEALRIATALRVIFHNTQKSTSLIAHLGLNGARMLSSSRGLGNHYDYVSIRFDLSSPEPVKATPILGAGFRELPVSAWWSTEPVFVHDGDRFSRKMIVLAAVNKDGGAHVDDTLDRFYAALSAGKDGFGVTGNLTFAGAPPFKQGVTHYAKNSHLALIRQFGHETMISARGFPLP